MSTVNTDISRSSTYIFACIAVMQRQDRRCLARVCSLGGGEQRATQREFVRYAAAASAVQCESLFGAVRRAVRCSAVFMRNREL